MCGRFNLATDLKIVAERFGVPPPLADAKAGEPTPSLSN
jgi:hypothetical protein